MLDEFPGSGENGDFAIGIAWEFAVFIRDESFEKAQVGAKDADFNAGNVFERSDGHVGKLSDQAPLWKAGFVRTLRVSLRKSAE